jgi:acyl CoA:acetate/3-ketoacid CoA transferase alpha subunit
MNSKVADLKDVRELIPDGSFVAIGGAWLCNHPMSIIRELIRAKAKNLTILTVVGSIDIELLLAAGRVRKLIFSFVSMEAFGLAPNFRRAIEKQAIEYEEVTGLAIILGLEATGRGVPFLPYRGPFGSDLMSVNPGFYKNIVCPFTNEDLVAVPAITPDVAIIHAQRADADGNIQVEGTSGCDVDMAKAADKVIVSVEEIVPSDEIRKSPEKTKIPRLYVDMVVEAPMGAHPTSCIPHYVGDWWHILEYMKMARDPSMLDEYLKKYVLKPEEQYIKQVGGTKKIDKLKTLVGKGKIL